jgi:hopanoid-associated phosphorylase
VAVATAAGEAAQAAAERLVAGGASALLSFGVAGGLDPSLRPGTIVIARRIHTPARDFPVDESWIRRLEAKLVRCGGVIVGGVAGADQPAVTVFDKATLFAVSGAMAADMESHRVAGVAATRGVPFLAVRAIADPAHRRLPQAALDVTAPDGSIRFGALIFGLLRRPTDALALPGLACDYQAAMRALRRAATEAGPTFAVR